VNGGIELQTKQQQQFLALPVPSFIKFSYCSTA